MSEKQDPSVKNKAATSISLETLIALGIFGWIALSMALMAWASGNHPGAATGYRATDHAHPFLKEGTWR